MRYSYKVKYMPGKDFLVADFLPRQPLAVSGIEVLAGEIQASAFFFNI